MNFKILQVSDADKMDEYRTVPPVSDDKYEPLTSFVYSQLPKTSTRYSKHKGCDLSK